MRTRKIDPNAVAMDVPKSCSVDKRGYVYINTGNQTVRARDGHVYTTHGKKAIGRLVDPANREDRRFYPNKYYQDLLNPPAEEPVKEEDLPEPPAQKDHLAVGFHVAVRSVAEQSGLASMLGKVFGTDTACQTLDLASYVMIEESAVMQHYSTWAGKHVLFSEEVRDDTWISRFLRDSLDISRINLFKDMWAKAKIGSGKVYFCYDSTNVNSQANGVTIVEKGHAKDDPDLDQVNTDYVVRQEDGLPLTFTEFPGSVVDVAQAPEMIEYFHRLSADIPAQITMICDRGYISEKNIQELEKAGIHFLLMVKSDLKICKELLDEYAGTIQRDGNRISGAEVFGKTVKRFAYGRERYFHLIWTHELERKDRAGFTTKIENEKKRLEKHKKCKDRFTLEELKQKFPLFDFELVKDDRITVPAKGRGRKNQEDVKEAYCIERFTVNEEKWKAEWDKCGIFILMSDEEMTAAEAYAAYSKRDCVEKVFQALKSHMGMTKYGVSSEERMHGKALVWFVASILYSLIFQATAELRATDKKFYTVPAIIRSLDSIEADRDLSDGTYRRRYQLTKHQREPLEKMGVKAQDIDACIKNLS